MNKLIQEVRLKGQRPEEVTNPEWWVDLYAELIDGKLTALSLAARAPGCSKVELKLTSPWVPEVESFNLLAEYIDQFADMVDNALEKYEQAKEILD